MVSEEQSCFRYPVLRLSSDECYRYRCSVFLSFSRIEGCAREPEWDVSDAQCYAVRPKTNTPSPVQLSSTSFLLGIGIGAEYPCGSVSASEQSEQPGINKRAQHRWLALATSQSITSHSK